MPAKYEGLDAAFLQYIGGDAQAHQHIHSYYVPFFMGCRRVADLACGQGNFVRALTLAGVPAFGVDADPHCVSAARAQGVRAIQQDVFEFLEQAQPGSLDGIFCAHLVEHLHYRQVLGLIELAYRALDEKGVIVLTTPNVRALFTHLESFYMHFGHVTFYHPTLLRFFMDYAGFFNPQEGENPRLAWPLWGGTPVASKAALALSVPRTLQLATFAYEQIIPCPKHNPFRRLIWRLKRWMAHMLVQPYIDRLVVEASQCAAENYRQMLERSGALNGQLESLLLGLDRPVECYVCATKSERQIELPKA